jgi:tetratricopeptide (TPR) repeat protein
VQALPGDQRSRTAAVLEVRALLDRLQGRREAAVAGHREALRLREEVSGGEPSPEVLRSMHALANTRSLPGADAAARAEADALYREALRRSVEYYGALHPRVAELRLSYATHLDEDGDLAGAQAQLDAALPALRAAFGPRSWQVGKLHLQAALTAYRGEAPARARGELAQALAVLRAQDAPRHSDLVSALELRAELEQAEGRLDAALATYDESLELLSADPSRRQTYAEHLGYSAEILMMLGRAPEALARFEQAWARLGADGEVSEALHVLLLVGLAEARLRGGAVEPARSAARAAAAAYERLRMDDPDTLRRISAIHDDSTHNPQTNESTKHVPPHQ